MGTLEIVLAILLGLQTGLWWGERTRRIDAQRARGIYRPPLTSKAKVTHDSDIGSAVVEGAPMEPLLKEEQVEKMISDTMRETGCSRKEAEEDVAHMLKAGAIMGLEH